MFGFIGSILIMVCQFLAILIIIDTILGYLRTNINPQITKLIKAFTSPLLAVASSINKKIFTTPMAFDFSPITAVIGLAIIRWILALIF